MEKIRIRRGLSQKGRRQLIAGVGVNDFNGPVSGHKHNGDSWELPSYKVWRAMLLRCYNEVTQNRHPTYKGCTVVEEWHKLTAFHGWFIQQGDWEGCDLDKDLLVPGNKIYGPNTCIKLPKYINVVVHGNTSSIGSLPCGVTVAPSGSYVARMRVIIDGQSKKVNIGCSFKTAEEASAAYVKAKKSYLQQVAVRLGGEAGIALLAFSSRL